MTDIDRRKALGLAALAAGAPVLAACGADDSSTGGTASSGGSTPTATAGGDAASGALTTTDKVPVGGGAIFSEEKVVVTQPTEGDFKAFSAVCTHEKCIVSAVEEKQIICSCHASHFSITDGSVESGPAQSPLPAVEVTVNGDSITLA